MNSFQKLLITSAIFLFSSQSNAQLGGMLKDLKSIADKAKQQNIPSQQQSTPESKPQPQLQSQPQNSSPQQNQQKSKVNSDGSLTLTKNDFLSEWCKSIDSSTLSSFDYKGVKTGDLCAQPPELIDQLFTGDTITINNSGPSTFNARDMQTKNLTILYVATLFDPAGKKIYITDFQGAICKTDPSNSLQPENNFRSALHSKYGEPDKQVTMYELLKPQQEALKKQTDINRDNAISVSEAKKARDGQMQADAIGNMLKNPSLKTEIAQLQWFYKGSQKRPDSYPGLLVWQPTAPTERRLCTNDLSGQFNFVINSNGVMVNKIKEMTEIASKVIKDKEKNAPTPKF